MGLIPGGNFPLLSQFSTQRNDQPNPAQPKRGKEKLNTLGDMYFKLLDRQLKLGMKIVNVDHLSLFPILHYEREPLSLLAYFCLTLFVFGSEEGDVGVELWVFGREGTGTCDWRWTWFF